MPHIVTARELLVEDIAEGTPILIPHGAGDNHVPGRITRVDPLDRNGVIRYWMKSDTGFETGGSFPNTRNKTPDAEGDLEVQVLDYIGSVTYLFSVFAPGSTPEECEGKLRQLLATNGFKVVGHIGAKPATEQKVIMRRGSVVSVCYEFETQAPCSTEFVDTEEPASV